MFIIIIIIIIIVVIFTIIMFVTFQNYCKVYNVTKSKSLEPDLHCYNEFYDIYKHFMDTFGCIS